jgi:F-type H+-transporting ATPase subunit epsilon
MSMVDHMQLALHIPSRALFRGPVSRINAVSSNGGFGILPNHVDFLTTLVPSVLVLTLPDSTERFFGIDEGLLVKQSHVVNLVVRRAVASNDLDSLLSTVADSFVDMEDEERIARTALSRLEANMVRRFVNLRTTHP